MPTRLPVECLELRDAAFHQGDDSERRLFVHWGEGPKTRAAARGEGSPHSQAWCSTTPCLSVDLDLTADRLRPRSFEPLVPDLHRNSRRAPATSATALPNARNALPCPGGGANTARTLCLQRRPTRADATSQISARRIVVIHHLAGGAPNTVIADARPRCLPENKDAGLEAPGPGSAGEGHARARRHPPPSKPNVLVLMSGEEARSSWLLLSHSRDAELLPGSPRRARLIERLEEDGVLPGHAKPAVHRFALLRLAELASGNVVPEHP